MAPIAAMILLAHCSIQYTSYGCVTRFPSGRSIEAHAHDTHHYHVIAHRCGYGDDILGYTREHDFLHSFMCETLFNRPSHILYNLAHDHHVLPYSSIEEELTVQAMQRWMRANERPIVGGMDWDTLKAKALRLIEREVVDDTPPTGFGLPCRPVTRAAASAS